MIDRDLSIFQAPPRGMAGIYGRVDIEDVVMEVLWRMSEDTSKVISEALAKIDERKHQEMLALQAELQRHLAAYHANGFAYITNSGLRITPINPWAVGTPTPIADLKAMKTRLDRLKQDCDLSKKVPHGGEFDW